jgi:hypothetical protein
MAVLLGAISEKLSAAQKKSLKGYTNLFDIDFINIFLKKEGYNFVSWREKSKPNEGTPTFPLSYFINNGKKDLLKTKYNSISFGKNGSVTIKTSKGFLQYI